ncbi:FadR family transcriptional regulator [Jatrophihabitans telluris]|uniref:FadR family transcriptional regulator n=1 Tax=Jatrophihabitans telluris TaxID=2038343 RepID=A0ABY4R3C3_9ACTN|nr:FadR/GntR family transcriptional regulator [Jatrophihabitans telluris]UQX89751.1 FadR family transcriptional regulator [Jatrophihabitans telluris]
MTSPGPARGYRADGVHGRLVHELGSRIVSGQLLPGEQLPTESELVTELASSRPAVREAIKVLTAKGLVLARPKVGTTVQPESGWNLLDPDVLAWRYESSPTGQQLDDLSGLRVAVEPEAARLAARTKRRETLTPIREAYLLMESSLQDPDEFIKHDLAFHRAVVQAGGNELLIHLDELLSAALAAGRQVHTRNVRRNRRTLPSHKAVLDAIVARQGEQAASLMRELVLGAQHDIRRDSRRSGTS